MCYEAFMLFILGSNNTYDRLHVGCSNYQNEIVKNLQHSICWAFEWEYPAPNAIPMPNESTKFDSHNQHTPQDEKTYISRDKKYNSMEEKKVQHEERKSRKGLSVQQIAWLWEKCCRLWEAMQWSRRKPHELETKIHASASTKLVQEQAE